MLSNKIMESYKKLFKNHKPKLGNIFEFSSNSKSTLIRLRKKFRIWKRNLLFRKWNMLNFSKYLDLYLRAWRKSISRGNNSRKNWWECKKGKLWRWNRSETKAKATATTPPSTNKYTKTTSEAGKLKLTKAVMSSTKPMKKIENSAQTKNQAAISNTLTLLSK